MTEIFQELETVKLVQAVRERDVSEAEDIEVPAGSEGLVVHVFGDAENPPAYLVEFILPTDRHVVVTALSDNLEKVETKA